MGIIDDLMMRQAALASERIHWESVWQDIVALAMPYASQRFSNSTAGWASAPLTGFENRPEAAERSRELYDSTAAVALDRLTAAMESMVTPRAARWHGLAKDDRLSGAAAQTPIAGEMVAGSDSAEEEWFDALTDYLFAARYDTRSGFAMANQRAIRAACGIGTGIVYAEENFGYRGLDPKAVPFLYRALPVAECYLGADAFGEADQCFRLHDMSARAALGYFGEDKVSQALRDMAADANQGERKVRILHAVMPREEAGEGGRGEMAFASFWLEIETRHLIARSGFEEFPFIVYHWDQSDGSPYGQSPIMAVLSDLKMLQVMNKNAVQASQQMIKPPMATMAGVYGRRLNLNPGKTNPGYLGEDGRLKVQPLITGQNPRLAEGLIEAKHNGVRESLYINLFRSLIDAPQMTATEAMIRQNEKAELLGPAGAKIQAGLSRLVGREIAILERRGLFRPDSALAPPPSLAGSTVNVRFTSSLDRQRRMADIQGVQATLEMAGQLAAIDPAVIDRIDADESLDIAQKTFGAPRRMLKADDEVAAMRLERAQAEQGAQAMQALGQAAQSLGDGLQQMAADPGAIAEGAVDPQLAVGTLVEGIADPAAANPNAAAPVAP